MPLSASGIAGIRLQSLPPLSLYVHIPWCVRKCPYCDFNSHESRGEAPETQYVDALIADLEQALPQIWGRRVYSIFLGGGTPSLFSARSIDRLLAAIRARVQVASDAEITLEANPGTFEMEKFRDFRAAGVNRLSIGVQSFNPAHLKALGRIHDEREAKRAVEIAQTHFEAVNLDLMYALPSQTLAEALADADTALSFGTQHLSFYHLTIEPNTYFYSYPPQVPDEDASADIHEAVIDRLVSAGYEHYETSAYAKPGHRCRHNLNYWRFGDYLGIGAGAHSKLSFHDRIVREARHKQPNSYLEKVASGDAVHERRELTRADLPFEFMLNLMRLPEGFAVSEFFERTGLQISAAEKGLRRAEEKGLIVRTHERIAPSERGQRYLNELLELFLPG